MINKFENEILKFFPPSLAELKSFLTEDKLKDALEIRIRLGRKMSVKFVNDELFFGEEVYSEDLMRLFENLCNSSIYAVQSDINQGFITLKGGHRVGISGTSVMEDDAVKNIKNISSLNIRIAREVIGCSNTILDRITKFDEFENTLIISPPGCGKTTLLRDMIKNLSDGYKNIKGKNISLIDERSEIAAMYKGIPQNNVGLRTDVMCNIPKWLGIKMMIRSMGPDIIATDEIGTQKDIISIKEAVSMGVKLLLTCHGNDILDISKELLNNHFFKNIIVLTKKERPCMIKNIYKWEDKTYVSCA